MSDTPITECPWCGWRDTDALPEPSLVERLERENAALRAELEDARDLIMRLRLDPDLKGKA